MFDNVADLGTVVVLDPSNLVEGQTIEIDGQPLVVARIIDEKVYLSPVTGIKLWKYHWNNLTLIGKFLLFAVVAAIIATVLHFI